MPGRGSFCTFVLARTKTGLLGEALIPLGPAVSPSRVEVYLSAVRICAAKSLQFAIRTVASRPGEARFDCPVASSFQHLLVWFLASSTRRSNRIAEDLPPSLSDSRRSRMTSST